jgi:hypothetical protein
MRSVRLPAADVVIAVGVAFALDRMRTANRY